MAKNPGWIEDTAIGLQWVFAVTKVEVATDATSCLGCIEVTGVAVDDKRHS